MSSLRRAVPLFYVTVALAWASLAMPASAQEVTTEQSDVRHFYDDVPVWEAAADASVELRAPASLTICRQGRVIERGGVREAHMGCWTQRTADGLRLDVPSGPGFLATRNGLDLTWLGGGPITLHDHDVLQVQIDDHLAVRVVGWVVVGLAVVAMAVGGIGAGTRAFSSDIGNVITIAIGAAAFFVGIALAFVGDGVSIAVAQPPAASPP